MLPTVFDLNWVFYVYTGQPGLTAAIPLGGSVGLGDRASLGLSTALGEGPTLPHRFAKGSLQKTASARHTNSHVN